MKIKTVVPSMLLVVAVLSLIALPPQATTAAGRLRPGSEPAGQVYYVAPGGNDANPGTLAQPWRTIQKAADTLTAGDTVYIRGGTYRERVRPQNSGAEGKYITYAAYPGETATVDGTGVTLPSWGGLFHVSGKNYIKISGLQVINAGPNLDNAGILVEYASYIVVENNYTDNTKSSGIGVWHSNNVVVAGNEVVRANNGGYQENITIASTNAFEVRDNYVHDSFTCTNGGEGIDIKHSFNGKVYRNHLHHQYCVGIYIDAWDERTYDIDVFQNIVHDVQGTAFALSSEMGALLEDIRLYDNLAYANDYGVYITAWGPASTHPMRNISVVNNTIADNGLGTWGGGVTVENPDVEAVTIANNIVSDNLSYQVVVYPEVPAAQVRVDYNLINGFRGLEDGETRGTHYVEADPRFVDPTAANYRLQATSPAINAGDNASLTAGVTTDLDGNPRLLGGRVDMGAYEDQYVGNLTRTFQQGLDGYSGVRDTWASSAGWGSPPQYTVNYGQNAELMLSRDGGDNPLLRFDLTEIPGNSAIASATLWLYNTTSSTYPRRAQLYRVLKDWDEGNQVDSPIDAPGKHGATGDYAFDYYPGEGTDVAWVARGMAAGADYAAAYESYADVVTEGWYSWDVTALVRAWVRGEQPNDGLVLRDATSYQDGNPDWRTFHASQSATADRRPKLAVTYNPDTPYANAGPDQTNLAWDGSAVTLDGSASHDRPGGDDASLLYEWRVAQPAYGSSIAPLSLIGRGVGGEGETISFTPDVPGEWEIELKVTNNLSQSATDTAHLRLLSIPPGHPRIYLTPAKLATLQARAVPSNPRWTQLLAEADDPDGEMHAKALVSQVTGQASYCDQAIAAAEALMADPGDYSTKSGDLALVYDWCYSRLSAAQRTEFVDYFNAWGDETHANDSSGWGNYWPRWGYSYALVGLAAYGDSPRAQEWLDEFRYDRHRDVDLALLERIATGGGWPEGMIYDWIANLWRVKALEAWRTATGEDLFVSTAWYRERLGYLLLHRWPGVAEQWAYQYHPYVSTGDTERNRGSIANYERIMALILVERFPDEALARQLQAYLSAPPTDNSMEFLFHEEFLWFNPEQGTATPSLLTHYAAGIGSVFMRSGWPSGAADTDTGATYLTFQCGDHFTYHQHYDQNSFTVFKRGDLLLDSGVYSGDGLSDHDINYYVRTIAHNTLVVYNPAEDFSHARPDAYANDGGQRTVYPASRSPQTIAYYDQHLVHYDTCNLLRFQEDARYTYALGDATKAYNNPTYNQAMDTYLSGNTAKVSRFQREFVYLRPIPLSLLGRGAGGEGRAEGSSDGEYVVLYDRVGVTDAAFSGSNTKLLFHVLNQPTVNGARTVVSPGETLYAGAGEASAVAGDGQVVLRFLSPTARNVRVVGQRGEKAFWVFDANYDWHWDPNEPQPRPTNDFEDVPYGEWRLELEPADDALAHNFLTVIHPTASTVAAHSFQQMPATTRIAAGGLEGVHIADPALNRVVLFSAAADGGAPGDALTYSYQPSAAQTLHLLLDLTPGARYRLTTAMERGVQTVTWTPDSGGAYQVSDHGVLSAMLANLTPAAPMVSIALSGTDVVLTWPPVTQDVNGNPVTVSRYEIWRSLSAYCVPGDAACPTPLVADHPGSPFTDVGAAATATPYFYQVRAVSGAGMASAASNRVGKFGFGLEPGGQLRATMADQP